MRAAACPPSPHAPPGGDDGVRQAKGKAVKGGAGQGRRHSAKRSGPGHGPRTRIPIAHARSQQSAATRMRKHASPRYCGVGQCTGRRKARLGLPPSCLCTNHPSRPPLWRPPPHPPKNKPGAGVQSTPDRPPSKKQKPSPQPTQPPAHLDLDQLVLKEMVGDAHHDVAVPAVRYTGAGRHTTA